MHLKLVTHDEVDRINAYKLSKQVGTESISVTSDGVFEAGYSHFFLRTDDGRTATAKVSKELLEDDSFDVASFIVSTLAEQLK